MHPLFLLQSDDPMKFVAIALGGIALIYLMVLRPMMRKKKDPLERQPAQSNFGQQRAAERDMQRLLVEYEQMIRNMTAGLDTRATKLELLIKEADEKIAALRAGLAGGGSSSSAPENPGSAASATVTPTLLPFSGLPDPDPRYTEIYSLVDQGLSSKEVARRLGRPDGEIDLIVRLRTKRD
jgi:DNA-binding NarL/FixJ family response regulator